MQTTPTNDALIADLFDRSQIVAELDGPQIEAWVSGLFPVFADDVSLAAFLEYCVGQGTPAAALLCCAIAELAEGDDQRAAELAFASIGGAAPAAVAQIGTSVADSAWTVEAPFGRSIIIGFSNPAQLADQGEQEQESDEAALDFRHSILVEVGASGSLEDLQLAGPARILVDEAGEADERVEIDEIRVDDAIAKIVAAWPSGALESAGVGPGVRANQAFVRRRLAQAGALPLSELTLVDREVDISRGMSDTEFAEANRAALSTLQAAVGGAIDPTEPLPTELAEAHRAWVSVLRGDAPGLSARESDALVWLEWADWLGAGIGLLRTGAGAPLSGSAMVDHVNRCPEVSSTIDKSDREYAEWAFEVALEVLVDANAIEDEKLTVDGFEALRPAMVSAWS